MNESSPVLQKLPKRLKDTAEVCVSKGPRWPWGKVTLEEPLRSAALAMAAQIQGFLWYRTMALELSDGIEQQPWTPNLLHRG